MPSVSAAVRVILVSHAASLGVLLAIALLCGDRFPQGDVLGCALVCGVFGALAVIAFYLALSRGAMGASAAVSGLLAAAIPSCVAMIQEGHPGWRRGTGFFVAGVAIWLIAGGTASGRRESRSTLRLAILAGAGFGIYFVALKFAATGGLIWPMAAARMASLTTVSLWLALLWFGRAPGVSVTSRMSATAIRWALSTALFDTAGNLAFMAATRVGLPGIHHPARGLDPKGKAHPPAGAGHARRSGSCGDDYAMRWAIAAWLPERRRARSAPQTRGSWKARSVPGIRRSQPRWPGTARESVAGEVAALLSLI